MVSVDACDLAAWRVDSYHAAVERQPIKSARSFAVFLCALERYDVALALSVLHVLACVGQMFAQSQLTL